MNEERKEIECTLEHPWNGMPVPKGHTVIHDQVETKENDCLKIHHCLNCGHVWLEENSW